jgi:hypothetical protein
MKKFLEQYNTILEQDETMEVPVEDPVESPVEQPASEPEVEQLSPEAEVLLVRLIKKALVTDIDSNDVDSISELSDINETNAKQSLQMLINIMKKYSQEIDVA